MIDRLLHKCAYSISEVYKSIHTDTTITATSLFKNWCKDLPVDDLGDKILDGYLKIKSGKKHNLN